MKADLLRAFAGRATVSVAVLAAGCSNSASSTDDDSSTETAGTTESGPEPGSAGSAGSSGPPTSSGGTTQSGGAAQTGGSGDTGGSTHTGGRTGGATQSGGRTGSGGATQSGGRTGSGGARQTGGAAGSGGGHAGAGGSTSDGGGAAGAGAGGALETGGSAGSDGAGVGNASIRLDGNRILDINGKVIVARGPEDVVASTEQTQDVEQAARLGANAMRMLFTLDSANGMTPAGFDTLLAEAVTRHMLVWVSLYTWDSGHDHVIASALGGGNFYSLNPPQGHTCSSDEPAGCYLAVWSRQWLKDLMDKYRSNVIVDAMQEFISPGDASTEDARVTWATAAEANIRFFRAQGYTNPLEIMANFQGRDLYGIVEYGESIRGVDVVEVDGDPQTMFGWQAYWGTTDGYYPRYQGALLTGESDGVVTGPDAIHRYAAPQSFPIEIGIDNFAGDTNLDYQAEVDQAAADEMSWLWWSWKDGTVECPVSGDPCRSYVTSSDNGFKGAEPLSN
jgi:hypothetical protein